MNLSNINRITENSYWKAALLLISFYILLPFRFTNDITCEKVESCLDPSWMLSLEWAIRQNLIFGKDFVFTYGPLGLFFTRSATGTSTFQLLLFDLFVVANLIFILHYALKKFSNIWAHLLCFSLVLVTSSVLLFVESIGFILLLTSFFWLNYALIHRRQAGVIVPLIISVFLFYYKINVGLIGLIIFYIYLIYYFFTVREHKIVQIAAGLSLPLLIFLASFPLNTDLPNYIRASLSFIDGYNDAMNTGIGEYRLFTALAILMALGGIGLFFVKDFKKHLLWLLTYGLLAYVLFKQSFVRSDLHIMIFFAVFPALVGITILFFEKYPIYVKTIVIAVCFLCGLIGFSLGSYWNPLNKSEYFAGILTGNDSDKSAANAQLFALPSEITDKIGQKSVDIVPWEIVFSHFNRLNYNPRPVVQSYAAFTPYLINLNYAKYKGETAPEFVIVSNKTIDNHYAFTDDQKVKLALVTDYKYDSSFQIQGDNYLLFQKQNGNASINFAPPVEESIKLGEEYNLKNFDRSYFIKADIEYTLLGKVVRLFYKPFLMWINFTLEDGSQMRHRIILPALKDGILINPYIENEIDLLNFMKDGQTGKKIRSFRFETFSSTAALNYVAVKSYDKTIKLSVAEVSIKKNSQ